MIENPLFFDPSKQKNIENKEQSLGRSNINDGILKMEDLVFQDKGRNNSSNAMKSKSKPFIFSSL